MKTAVVSSVAAVLLWPGLSLADPPPGNAGPRAACRADVDRLCPGVQPGDGRIMACLKQNQAELSSDCKDALAKAREKRAPGAPSAPQG